MEKFTNFFNHIVSRVTEVTKEQYKADLYCINFR